MCVITVFTWNVHSLFQWFFTKYLLCANLEDVGHPFWDFPACWRDGNKNKILFSTECTLLLAKVYIEKKSNDIWNLTQAWCGDKQGRLFIRTACSTNQDYRNIK